MIQRFGILNSKGASPRRPLCLSRRTTVNSKLCPLFDSPLTLNSDFISLLPDADPGTPSSISPLFCHGGLGRPLFDTEPLLHQHGLPCSGTWQGSKEDRKTTR